MEQSQPAGSELHQPASEEKHQPNDGAMEALTGTNAASTDTNAVPADILADIPAAPVYLKEDKPFGWGSAAWDIVHLAVLR